jgi:hypothetical protein
MKPQITLRGFITILEIAALFAVLGWMGNRDREHQQELQAAPHVAHECDDLPVVEMSMPIQELVQS